MFNIINYKIDFYIPTSSAYYEQGLQLSLFLNINTGFHLMYSHHLEHGILYYIK